MLNTKNNLKHKKLTEALQETTAGADRVLLMEMLLTISDVAGNMVQTMNFEEFTEEDVAVSYELAEMCNYALDKIFNRTLGIE